MKRKAFTAAILLVLGAAALAANPEPTRYRVRFELTTDRTVLATSSEEAKKQVLKDFPRAKILEVRDMTEKKKPAEKQ